MQPGRTAAPSLPNASEAIFKSGLSTIITSNFRIAMFSTSRMLAVAFASALAVTAVTARTANAQATPPPTKAATMDADHMSHMGKWAPMDEFHMLLMATWHPVKEGENLAPTRAMAATMATKADAWAKSAVPAMCKSGTNAAVIQIATDARALATLVAANATDAQVRSAISGVHDKFEAVEEGCSAPKATTTPPARS